MRAERAATFVHSLRIAGVAFAAVFGSAYASILITRGVADLAPVWPANAIALVLLLRAPAWAWTRLELIAGAALGSVLANWLGGSSLPLSLWFTVGNGVEVLVAFLLIRRRAIASARDESAASAKAFRAVLLAGLLGPAASATISAAGLATLAGAPYGGAWLDWFLTASLGMLIVAPLGVSVSGEDWTALKTTKGVRSMGLCALSVVTTTAAVFAQSAWPLLFLITPAILYAAYRRRALGAAVAVALAAAIAVPLTAIGRGPLFEDASPHDRQFLLQLFLLTQSLVALSLAGALNERDGLRRVMEARERRAVEDAQAKSRLLMGVAHDIRTPLNAIQGLGELLAKNESLPQQDRRLVEDIIGASAQLQTLANDLLDRSRIERGALVLAPQACVAGELIGAIVDEARDWPEADGVTIKTSAPGDLVVWADAARAGQILRNFVSNAVKYAGAHGPIVVAASAVGEATRLEVLDCGPGVAPARQHDVFEPFARIGAGAASTKGAGVGLSLVKLLAEAQGGRVGFSSTPFVETRFWVDLPSCAPEGAPMAEEALDIDPDTVF